MISEVTIHGFKRFHHQQFDVCPLTILTGLNGSGKTSFIHALLLVKRASAYPLKTEVGLKDLFGVDLGTAASVRNWTSTEIIEISMRADSNITCTWKFGVPADEALYLSVQNAPNELPTAYVEEPRAFTYLCAERLGPRLVLADSPHSSESLEVGVRGEFCAQILGSLGSKPLEDKQRIHPEKDEDRPSFLKYEVERWLGQIARPIEIDPVFYPGSAFTALQFRSPGGEWVRAPNMGFGVSYALPIILAGLTARPGGLLVVENPEAHLHPAGQSRMGVFLAWLAGRGVQVILETHSDHVLNGVRRAIAEYAYLSHEKALVHFFDPVGDHASAVQHLKFSAVGSVSDWPRGFFDQYQIDVSTLGRLRRPAVAVPVSIAPEGG